MAKGQKPIVAPAVQQEIAKTHRMVVAGPDPRSCKSVLAPESREAIGLRLRFARKALGFTLGAFASKCGLSRTRYQHFEAGRNLIRPEQAIKVFRAFPDENLDFNWLYAGDMSGISPRIADAINACAKMEVQSRAGVVNE